MDIVKLLTSLPPEEVQDIAVNIERLPRRCHARIYLRSRPRPPQQRWPYDVNDVEKALRYMFLSYQNKSALVQACNPDMLAALYRAAGGAQEFDDMIADSETVACALLDHLGIRHRVETGPMYLRGTAEALDDILDLEKVLSDDSEADPLSFMSWQGGSLSAWSIVESVLKLTLGFVILHLGDSLPHEVVKQFKDRRISTRSGGQVIQAFEDIESCFSEGQVSAVRDRRKTELSKSISEEVRRSREVIKERAKQAQWPKQETAQAIEHARMEIEGRLQNEEEGRITAERLQAEQLRGNWFCDFHRKSPFDDVPTTLYREWYKLERNRMAHRPIQDLFGPDIDNDALEPLKKAKSVVQGLQRLHVVPRLITILGKGRDADENLVLWFTNVANYNALESRKMPTEWMFRTIDADRPLLQPFAMLAPISLKEAPAEPLIEPVMYSLREIEDIL